MKRLIGIASAITCAFAAPAAVQALPTYASLIAMDHCQYLSYGWTWDDAISQALSDNYDLWGAEMDADGERSNRAIAVAINERCGSLNSAAFNAR